MLLVCFLPKPLPEVVSFIARARQQGTGVLVHCMWGVSRSVTLLLAYMISPQVCGLVWNLFKFMRETELEPLVDGFRRH